MVESPDGEWLTDSLTNEAMDFIKKHKEDPFFVNLHYYAPHRPSVSRNKALLEKYKNKAEDALTQQGAKSTKEIVAYATMVEALDENVGRLLTFLDDEGLRENTIIIFTSDNGFNSIQSKNATLRGHKGSVYEGGIRVPALVNWQGKIQAGIEHEYIHGIDYFPTFLDLVGIRDTYMGVLDGKSLLPVIAGKEEVERPLFWHLASTYKNPACTVMRRGDWKLIQFLVSKKTELYNLKNNPLESEDLSSSHPEKLQELLKEMLDWRAQNSVPLPPAAL